MIEETLDFVSRCFSEALVNVGQCALADYIPWSDKSLTVDQDNLPVGIEQLYSISFQLLNMVEELAAGKGRKKRATHFGGNSLAGSWENTLHMLHASEVPLAKIKELLPKITIQPVLTAHPTEAKRTTVRERHLAIYNILKKRQEYKLSPRQKALLREELITSLEILWQTKEIHLVRPTLEDELRNALHYFRQLYPAAVTANYHNFIYAWEQQGLPPQDNYGDIMPKFAFGNWIGGDRDGHPLVTAEVTANSLQLLRYHACSLWRQELKSLAQHLTVMPTAESIKVLKAMSKRLQVELNDSNAVTFILEKNKTELWREVVFLLRQKVIATAEDNNGYCNITELIADIKEIEDLLIKQKCHRLVRDYTQALRYKMEVFGLHLAVLDIRQNSDFHDRAMAQILTAIDYPEGADYPNWHESKKRDFLSQQLAQEEPLLPTNSDFATLGVEAEKVLTCYQVIHQHIQSSNSDGVGLFIVSMTRSLSDLLIVSVLQKEANLLITNAKGELVSPWRIAPLFETINDLKNAPQLVADYICHPFVQRSFATAGVAKQHIMLGYSDSNKDCGILASQEALFIAQQECLAVAKAQQVELAFFHGRGGTISRGAGPIDWFMQGLPHQSLQHSFRMTEQGESIAQKYAYYDTAVYNLELLAASVTKKVCHDYLVEPANNSYQFMMPAVKDDRSKVILTQIAQWSADKYQALLHEEYFISFYRQATIIDALENARIGSRPAKRRGDKGFSLDDLRAIPWVFSWMQSRFYLPGWFGVGSALQQLQQQQPSEFDYLRENKKVSALLSYVFTNIETNILSTTEQLMCRYGDLVVDKQERSQLMAIILAEYSLTKSMLEQVFKSSATSRRPRIVKTIAWRKEPLEKLHQQQIKLLQTWRSCQQEMTQQQCDEVFEEILLCINAIASGIRNTG